MIRQAPVKRRRQTILRRRLADFTDRLRAVRAAQLKAAAARAERAKIEYRAEQKRRDEAREKLRATTCPDCDWKITVVKRWELGRVVEVKVCRCGAPCPQRYLVRMLRRLAGIGGGHAGIRLTYDERAGGKVGMRTCTPANWDNAIRAVEEER